MLYLPDLRMVLLSSSYIQSWKLDVKPLQNNIATSISIV